MNLCAVILAAGHGKRMNSSKPKVLHEVLGKPMVQHVIDTVNELKPKKLVIVVGNKAEEVKTGINNKPAIFIKQKRLLGTGNALLEVKKSLKGLKNCTTIVLSGDSPLITSKTLKSFLKSHRKDRNDISFLSFTNESLKGYGRVLRNKYGNVTGIIEEIHVSKNKKSFLRELNSGIYAIESKIMTYLDKLKKHMPSGEYYLTDIVSIASNAGKKVEAYNCSFEEAMGINTRAELHNVSEILNKKIISKWMSKGVTFLDPSSTIVHPLAIIGKDSVIYPNSCLEGNTKIGRECTVYPGARIYNSIIEQGATIKDNSVIENSLVGRNSTVGPLAHLRPGSSIGRNVKIGNFVELKQATIGDNTNISHLSYIGDAIIGKNVNIGAGTITCNYDGHRKHITTIETGSFIGTDSQLIAPVKIGKGAYIAAGSTITKDVPAGALAISRVKQENLKGWGRKKQLRVKSEKSKVISGKK